MPFPLDEDVRREITEHFRRRGVPFTEEGLRGVLEDSRSPTDVYMAVIGLRGCGTHRSLPALERQFTHAKRDVRATAILTHAHIAGASGTPVYARALLDPAWRDKGYPMTAIADAADHRAIDAVLKHFQKRRARIRRGRLWDGTFAEGVAYLGRHLARHPAIEPFFEEILSWWDELPIGDRAMLVEQVGWFRARRPAPTPER